MKPDGYASPESILKIIPLQHPGHRNRRRQLQYLVQVQQLQPFPVKTHLRLLPVQNAENLFLVSLGVEKDFLLRHGFPSLAFSCGIADFCCEIPDHNHNGMPQILHLLQLPQGNRMAQMNIRRAGIHAEFDDQGPACGDTPGNLPLQFRLSDQLLRPLPDHPHLVPNLSGQFRVLPAFCPYLIFCHFRLRLFGCRAVFFHCLCLLRCGCVFLHAFHFFCLLFCFLHFPLLRPCLTRFLPSSTCSDLNRKIQASVCTSPQQKSSHPYQKDESHKTPRYHLMFTDSSHCLPLRVRP